MGFIVQWCEDGTGRWSDCEDVAGVRAAAAAIARTGAARDARVTAKSGAWTVVASVAELARWAGGAPPRALLASIEDCRSAEDRSMKRFLSALRAACARGVADGLLAPRQAQALASIGEMALRGAGPAGCTPDLDVIRPARLSSWSKAG